MIKLNEGHLKLMNIGRRYWGATIDDFSEKQKKVIGPYITNFTQNLTKGLGLYIYGENGYGKSYISSALCKWVWSTHRLYSYCLTAWHLINSWKSFKDPIMVTERQTVADRVMKIPFLVIDDLGKEHRTQSGFSEGEFNNLLRERSRDTKITLITSNLTPIEFKNIYGESSAQLSKECLLPVRLIDKNWREEARQVLYKEHF